jgi:hypothetical protein
MTALQNLNTRTPSVRRDRHRPRLQADRIASTGVSSSAQESAMNLAEKCSGLRRMVFKTRILAPNWCLCPAPPHHSRDSEIIAEAAKSNPGSNVSARRGAATRRSVTAAPSHV